MEPDLYNVRKNNIGSLAIVSLVFAILSFILCPFIGGIIAVICASVELSSIKRGVASESGRVMSLISLWLGIVNIAIILIIIILISIGISFFPEILDWFKRFDHSGDINVIYRLFVNSFAVIAYI
ncbi:MAG TPA: DUF4190 domain-containing protein [Ignavibacteria bacterium]|nr:DUF4190 domain-containing protein [Ignavibacteria bacterium]